MVLTKKIAIAAGALTLAAGGAAAAAVTTPEQADDGLTTAEEQVGTELPASKDARPGATPEAPEAEEEQELVEAEEEQELVEAEASHDEDAPPADTHGAKVSAVAQSDEHEGREHGEAVSTVARDNPGAEASDGAGDDLPEEADEGEQGRERAAEARAQAPAGRP